MGELFIDWLIYIVLALGLILGAIIILLLIATFIVILINTF